MWEFDEEEMEDRIFQRKEQMMKKVNRSVHDDHDRDNLQLRRVPLWRQSWTVFLPLPRILRSEETYRYHPVQPSCPYRIS